MKNSTKNWYKIYVEKGSIFPPFLIQWIFEKEMVLCSSNQTPLGLRGAENKYQIKS